MLNDAWYPPHNGIQEVLEQRDHVKYAFLFSLD